MPHQAKPVTVVTIIIPELLWRIAWSSESKCWIAACKKLNLTASGDSFSEAVAFILSCMEDRLNACREDGSLLTFLAGTGTYGLHGVPVDSSTPVQWNVPFDLRRAKDVKDLNR